MQFTYTLVNKACGEAECSCDESCSCTAGSCHARGLVDQACGSDSCGCGDSYAHFFIYITWNLRLMIFSPIPAAAARPTVAAATKRWPNVCRQYHHSKRERNTQTLCKVRYIK
ncbi:hypothetical protein M413DRAFT_268175 [Hebeloma cylindrosporum]|uniref:Uncharacterized protein n=1 Tax=Hebeloma cylindrosporum TaxID=76867 RepID=A0A0C2YB22_HEBCY|nr:hypothetical protein M413DRAFT_268175 [Hebeloma cylindrosporum h7]